MGTSRTIKIGILTAPHIDYTLHEHTFTLRNVRIGIGFHWDRHEDQDFAGTLEILPCPNPVLKRGKPWQVAVNTIGLEDYLCSVISSEMNANSPMELLRAHAIISRSWAIRAMENKPHARIVNGKMTNIFDVCADDHCQRYEGLRRMNERAVEAVRSTEGQVLAFDGKICDCRYHKCCGGRTEIWRTCWENIDVPYIQSVECPYCDPERNVQIVDSLMADALNDYDRETTDFHDWQVSYTDEELDAIIRDKSGIDFGHITAIEPLHRGPSGRIDSLRIIGTNHTEVIGKELKIRLWLSRTCLYSSWFEVNHQSSAGSGQPLWVIRGHGWGHGAGLCQIGAAVMAQEGHDYRDILAFYYPGSELRTL